MYSLHSLITADLVLNNFKYMCMYLGRRFFGTSPSAHIVMAIVSHEWNLNLCV